MKVATHNNILKTLVTSKWGTNTKHYKNNGTGPVLLTRRICCSSIGEIFTDVKNHDRHAGATTGFLKPIYVEDVYLFAGIVPPNIRSDVYARMERPKQMEQETSSLFGHLPAGSRLMLRKDCVISVKPWYLLPNDRGDQWTRCA